MLEILLYVDEVGGFIVAHELFVQLFYALRIVDGVSVRHVIFVVRVVAVGVVLCW